MQTERSTKGSIDEMIDYPPHVMLFLSVAHRWHNMLSLPRAIQRPLSKCGNLFKQVSNHPPPPPTKPLPPILSNYTSLCFFSWHLRHYSRNFKCFFLHFSHNADSKHAVSSCVTLFSCSRRVCFTPAPLLVQTAQAGKATKLSVMWQIKKYEVCMIQKWVHPS